MKKEDERFRQKLNTETLYNEWITVLNNYSVPSNDRMLLVDKQQRDGRQQLRLKVNFSPELIEFCKAVRTIRSMGMRPPFRIINSKSQKHYSSKNNNFECANKRQTIFRCSSHWSCLSTRHFIDPIRSRLSNHSCNGCRTSWSRYVGCKFAKRIAQCLFSCK